MPKLEKKTKFVKLTQKLQTNNSSMSDLKKMIEVFIKSLTTFA